MGRGAGGPYVGAPGKALAVYPLGSSGPLPMGAMSKSYSVGALAKYPAIERTRLRRPLKGGRKAYPGGQISRSIYEPKLKSIKFNQGLRRAGPGNYNTLPIPVISAANVLRLEAAGFQLPRKVLQQAHMGQPIVSNFKPSNRMKKALAQRDPRLVPALLEFGMPVPNRFSENQLGLPPSVRRKLHAMEGRARSLAIEGTAKAVATPWVVRRKVSNATGRAAAAIGRGARYAASLPGRAKRASVRFLQGRGRKLPN